MRKEDFISFTSQLYKLTLLFPKKEPLRYKMRELADDILASLIPSQLENISIEKNELKKSINDLEILDSYFEIAKSQNWVSLSEILNLQEEYSKIRGRTIKKFLEIQVSKVKDLKGEKKESISVRKSSDSSVSERQQKIIEILKEKEKSQVWEFKKVFPEVSKRTLRRDFEQLLSKGLVQRIGEYNMVFYKLKRDGT
ncbi:DeoR family transcriptional regulator [Patescibacteria group bacterium]